MKKYIFEKFYIDIENYYRNKNLSLVEIDEKIQKEMKQNYKTEESKDFSEMIIEIFMKLKSEKENN